MVVVRTTAAEWRVERPARKAGRCKFLCAYWRLQDLERFADAAFSLLLQVCYSWWNLSALSILGKLHWINEDKLTEFILESQASSSSLSDALHPA